jgi:chemotaxis protein methyltransferase CheR
LPLSPSSRNILAALLEARTGQQLALNRSWRFEASLAPLLRERGLATVDQLAARLASGVEPGLADTVVEALLNNETYFFRDRPSFELVRQGVLRRLALERAKERRLAIWCAGCSTGQEAYSLAMMFADEAPRWHGWTVEIVGTDVSSAAIGRARRGVYSQFEVQRGLAVREMLRWFEERGGGEWGIAPALIHSVRFEVRNVMDAPPGPGRFDIILCRNLLLYLSPERRGLAFDRLAEAIAPDGSLMLGAGETVIGQTAHFRPDPEERGLYVPVPADDQSTRTLGRAACGG